MLTYKQKLSFIKGYVIEEIKKANRNSYKMRKQGRNKKAIRNYIEISWVN